MNAVDNALATADRAWRAYGVRRTDRAALAADLRLDLESAAADGIEPAQLLGTDVPAFARRLADAAGLHREPPELGRLVGTALAGAALGALLGFTLTLFAWPAVRVLNPSASYDVPVQVAVGLYYGILAAIVVAGAVATVRFGLRKLPKIGPTAWMMALLLPVAGIVVTPITMAFAWTTGYSTAGPVVLAEVLLVAGALAGATVLARRWALREPSGQTTTAPA